jgi:type IV pilus assembly protein PilV
MLMKSSDARATTRRSRSGFALIEALVALLIFSLSALALIGLQTSMMRAQTNSKFRGDATFLASDLIGVMWSDTPNLASYANCLTYAPCRAWSDKVSDTLPNGSSTLSVNATTKVVTIDISWTAPNEPLHTYSTSTTVAGNTP